MVKKRRSKTNTTFFEDIEESEEKLWKSVE
jgi:hypothetical protein